jgi:hypothetical protein
MEAARSCLSAILAGRPDRGTEPPGWTVEIIDRLSRLTTEELAALADPLNGLATVCKFLPTPADIHGFLRARREKLDQFQSHTFYARLQPDPRDCDDSPERKKAVVMAALGYDPGDNVAPKHKLKPEQRLEKPSLETVDKLLAGLKSPARPPSDELIALLKATDYHFPQPPEDPDS